MRTYSRPLRTISAVVLFFFVWSFGPAYAPIAWAEEKLKTEARGQTIDGRTGVSPVLGPAERFEKALEDIREKAGKLALSKVKGAEDITSEIEAIKKQRIEIEKIDIELKKEFAATEKKLKDAKLPQEILDRHYKFVKHYEDNLAELKANFKAVEQYTVDSKQGKDALKRAKEHLEKTKPPRKHVPLDPNRLPHRNRVLRTKWREPRTAPEQFRKDFPPKRQKNLATNRHEFSRIEKNDTSEFLPQSTQSAQRTASNPPASPFAKGGQEGDLISAADVRGKVGLRNWIGRENAQEAQEFGRELAPSMKSFEGRLILTNGFKKKANGQKPILLAYNGSIDDLSLINSEPKTRNSLIDLPSSVISVANSFTPQSEISLPSNVPIGGNLQLTAFSDSTPIILAQQTADLPTPEDYAETPPAIKFTDTIRAKARDELGCNPTKIYNWVRNNIFYEPYYGSFKSADQTLLEGAGNDFDQASLLISLMRVCHIASKFAYGTVEIPAEKAANLVGVSDPRAAATIYSTQGIPVKLVMLGTTVKSLRLERAWVEAWIDYFPSWGARHRQGGEDTWIPLDPSFKQYSYKQGMDMYAQMGFNAEQFLQSYITDTRNITAYQDYSMRLISFIDANYPDAEVEDILGASEIKLTKTIIKQEFPYLLGTLPYKTIVKAAEFSQIPPSKDYAITIQIEGNALDGSSGLTYSGYLNYLTDKRVTVSYEPATSTDEALVAQYGSNMLAVPPYLLNVKPVLKIAGLTVAIGAPIGLGQDHDIIINFAGPDGDMDRIQNVITAGAYSAVILQSQDTPVDSASKNMAKLIENSKKIDLPEITIDDLLGQILYSIGVSYFHTLSFENEVFAKTLQIVNMRQPSEAMVTQGVKVDYVFGLPRTMSVGGVNIDVDRNVNTVYSPAQDKDREKAFMILSGLSSSVSENRILEAFFNVASLSAVRLLKLASEQGILIYTITNC